QQYFAIKQTRDDVSGHTIEIHILIIRGWGDRERSYDQVGSIFNYCMPDHGTVTNLPKSGRTKTATTEAKRLDILQTFIENPHRSLRSVGMEHDVCHETVRKVLKSVKFHPYKLHWVEELNEDDPDRRIEFC
ncbi:hypothetical protein PV326_012172, partial [Microctonus aethiopoides]